MKLFRLQPGSPERGLWTLAGLMLTAVLVPTACLIYFMNEAVDKERTLSARQLNEAYAAELQAAARDVQRSWEQRLHELDARNGLQTPSAFFEHCVRDGIADSVIVLDEHGAPAYPALPAAPGPDPTLREPAWAEARALEGAGELTAAAQSYAAIYRSSKEVASMARAAQASIRCVLASGKTLQAAKAISEYFAPFDLEYATGPDGRYIYADELTLLLNLQPPNGPDQNAQRLFSMLQNYTIPIPAGQRLYLMDWLRGLNVQARYRTFPTYHAERIAERVLSAGPVETGPVSLHRVGIAGGWALPSPGHRAIGYYEDATVNAAMAEFTSSAGPSHGRYRILPPGSHAALAKGAASQDLAPMLPGWRIALANAADDPAAVRAASQGRIASYSWIGLLAIAAAATLAVAGATVLRRQMQTGRLKADLVAAVSHELKTPLASMKLLVESLLSGESFDPARTRRYLEMVARENNRLSRLIDNFLTFSRMERSRGKFEFTRVAPQSVVEHAMESIGDRFPVEAVVAPGLPPLYADEDALVTVLLNVLENAYKYTGADRRIRLSVAPADPLEPNGAVAFTVSDNGIGIARREQKKIFRRFYQVDRSLSRRAGGVGLGLSIVAFIVEAHGGKVTVESTPGVGSAFRISLPPSAAPVEVAV
jgi:signal transduction histidine kinase